MTSPARKSGLFVTLAGATLLTVGVASQWTSSPAPQVLPVVSLELAERVLHQMSSDPRLPNRTAEYGCADRAEVVIAALLREGVPAAALGRVSLLSPDLSRNFLAEANAALERGDAADTLAGRAASVPDPWIARLLPQLLSPSLEGADESVLAREDGTLRVGPYTLHPAPRAVWSVGHIAAYAMVAGKGSAEARVLDPALSPERLITFDAWKALQSLPEGLLVASSLAEEKPALVIASLTDTQRRRVADLLGVEPTADAIATRLGSFDEQDRARFYNRLFGLEPDSALRYEKWAGYTIAGGPTADGMPLPRWNAVAPTEPGFLTREQRAVEQLAPLVKFEAFLSRLEDAVDGRAGARPTATTSERSSSSGETPEPSSQR